MLVLGRRTAVFHGHGAALPGPVAVGCDGVAVVAAADGDAGAVDHGVDLEVGMGDNARARIAGGTAAASATAGHAVSSIWSVEAFQKRGCRAEGYRAEWDTAGGGDEGSAGAAVDTVGAVENGVGSGVESDVEDVVVEDGAAAGAVAAAED